MAKYKPENVFIDLERKIEMDRGEIVEKKLQEIKQYFYWGERVGGEGKDNIDNDDVGWLIHTMELNQKTIKSQASMIEKLDKEVEYWKDVALGED
jgi:hypothetical protein